MNKKNPVIVYVGNDDRATDFMEASDTYVLGAPTLQIALAQIMFSNPDAIIIDATPENMLIAEDTYFHLRTLRNLPVVVLSDMPGRWDTTKHQEVSVLLNDASAEEIMAELQHSGTQELAEIR